MAPKKAAEAGKRKRELTLLEGKKEIIRKHEEGMHVIDLAREYRRNASTITQRNFNASRRNLRPDCVVSPEASTQEPAATEEIISLGQIMGLEVSEEDVTALVEGHTLELSIEDLVGLQQEQQQGLRHDTLEEQEKELTQVPFTVLRRACALWGELQTLVNEHHDHEHQAEAHEDMDQFDHVVMASWRAMLRKRQKQQTMDQFVVKQARQEDEPSCSAQLPSSASAQN